MNRESYSQGVRARCNGIWSECGGQGSDVRRFVLCNLYETAAGKSGEASMGEGSFVELVECPLVEHVLEMLKGERVLEDLGDGWVYIDAFGERCGCTNYAREGGEKEHGGSDI